MIVTEGAGISSIDDRSWELGLRTFLSKGLGRTIHGVQKRTINLIGPWAGLPCIYQAHFKIRGWNSPGWSGPSQWLDVHWSQIRFSWAKFDEVSMALFYRTHIPFDIPTVTKWTFTKVSVINDRKLIFTLSFCPSTLYFLSSFM